MKRVLIYLAKTNKLSYQIVVEGLSNKKISNQIAFTHSERGCDVEIDCEFLIDKEQFDKAAPQIFQQIWTVYKKINTKRQKNQKKVRNNFNLN